MLTNLYLKKDDNPIWIIKPRFDSEERRLNLLFLYHLIKLMLMRDIMML